MYPIAMNQASRVLPPWILTASIGWIAGFGQTGSALLPFITGAIASKAGITALQPMYVEPAQRDTCAVTDTHIQGYGHDDDHAYRMGIGSQKGPS